MTIAPPDQCDIERAVSQALSEDIGSGDITAQLIASGAVASARLISRENAVFCGLPWAREVIRQTNPGIQCQWHVQDGDRIGVDQLLAICTGPARSLLSAERTLLNFLQTLSGTATISRHYADLVRHTRVRLLDTRKTIPGLRLAQKYAVRVGGCFNHRIGLYDAFLIKENHIRSCGSVAEAIERARRLAPDRPVEIEVETLLQLQEAIDAGADSVLLDNFDLARLREAVALNRQRVKLEASGGIDDAHLVQVAETGVDFISIGALTKHCRAVDLSLRFV
ncbi:MAG: nicotinate-nucleotide pyrophosphorylase [Pseudomonadota bacterium]|jgi:nicotinate-nucleotide pyrophosphorylase (carboxylating)